MTNKYELRSKQNVPYSNQLFYDRWKDLPPEKQTVKKPPFTLSQPREGFICFGKEYVDLEDPTGYKITQKLLAGDYSHWLFLNKFAWFVAEKAVWDRELEAKLVARGIDVLKRLAKPELSEEDSGISPAVQLQAAKFLAQKGFIQNKPKAGRGRPTNEEVEGELKRQADLQTTFSEDLARIGKKGTN